MKINLENKSADFGKSGKKGKKQKEVNHVGIEHTNNLQTVNEYSNTNMLKRSLIFDENKPVKKQKRNHITDSSLNNVNHNEELSKEPLQVSQEHVQIEHLKLVNGIIHIYFLFYLCKMFNIIVIHKFYIIDAESINNSTNFKDKEDANEQTQYLDGNTLRKIFNSPNGIDMLRKFVKICNENKERDLAAEYLNTGGNIFEILRLLDTSEVRGISTLTLVFAAVKILLIKILTNYPQYQSSAEEACRHLINSHLSSIHSMISVQSNMKQRKIILQLLAVIVSLGGNLPRELLSHLAIPPEIVKSLVEHTKPTDKQNIRNCFIHFILAFLIEGSVPIIRALLDKQHLLSSIFPDLIYDSKEVVALILTTLKTYVLQNPSVSKTMKLQIFSTSVIQNLVSLYNWKGPNNWPKHKAQNTTSNSEYLEEKEIVMEIVNDFLILLLTSHRYGIIFHDRMLGTSNVKHNYMVNAILQNLDRPWEHEKPSNLIIKIMTACPDLIKSQFILLEPYIEPRASVKWIVAIKFIREIIQSVDVETCIKTSSLELNVFQLSSAMLSLILPGIILKKAIIPALTHSNMIVRHEAVLTLISMFNQIQKCLIVTKTIYKEDGDFCIFKNCIIQFMLKNVPILNTIVKVWNCAFTSDLIEDNNCDKEHIPEPKKQEHLTAVLNLLHMYSEVCPKLLDTLPDMQPDTFLNLLNKLDDTDSTEFNAIKVKAIQFLVILHPNEFLPDTEIFKEALLFLIGALNEEVSAISLSAKVTIKTLLNATGMFEGCSDHLDIWINGFININDREVTKWFIRSINKTSQNIEKYVNKIIEAEEILNQEIVRAGKLENIFNELMNKPNVHENVESTTLPMQRFTSLSPLLCCMLYKTKKDLHPSILSYLSYILIHTLHYQISPQCLIHLTKDIEGLPLKEYLSSWLDSNQPINIKTILPSMTLICKLNSELLSDTKLQISEIFSGNNTVSFEYNGENITICHSLSTYDIIYSFKMTTFYLAQFAKRDVLTKIQYDNYKILLISLLYLAKNSSDDFILVEECVKSILTHPIILHYFSPLKKSKNIIKNKITLIVIDVCSVTIDLCKKCNVRSLFSHFKNKFLMQLCKMIDEKQKEGKLNNFETVTTLLEVLQLTSKDIVYLLKKIIKLESSMFVSNNRNDLSIYGYVSPKLLKLINNNEMKSERNAFFELNAEFVKFYCLHLLYVKLNLVANVEMWESALHEYLLKFSFNISGIDTSIFTSLLSTTITGTTVGLISFLISRNITFIPIFTESIMKSDNIKKPNVVLPLIESNLNVKWNQDFLQKLRKHHETEILSYLRNPKNPKSWIEENIMAICYLIKTSFDFKTCNETCNTILNIGDKLDMVSVHYIKLLQTVYYKCADLETRNYEFIMNLTQVLLHIITLTLKQESKNIEKLYILCEALNNAVNRLRDKRENFVFEALSTNHSWSQFTRFSLKFSLKKLRSGEEPIPILRTLSNLCNITYKNDSNNKYVETLFEMTTSHSEFINIMLESSNTKGDLVKLLWILIQKNKTVMALSHIPVYLAAYNATLTETDQYILLILQYYESNNFNIYEYRPYIWGNAAAIHYSVKGETHTVLWRQPSISQVLNLFEEDMVNNTIKHYPVDRDLKNNDLCKTSDVYDPAFYLPLLCFLLSENNIVPCYKIVQSGALALTLAACSSNHSDIRMVAYTVIARYYIHLEASRAKAKLLWMRLIDALRYGIMSQQSKLTNVRLNCLVSTFLARTSLIATHPLHPLYSALQAFLMAKPAMDINTIPELLQLFHSSDVEYKAHRYWILENIRDGIKTENELDIAFRCVLFKMLLDFYISTLSDETTKKTILEIIDVTLKITKGSILLIESHGLLPWLLEVARNSYKYGPRHIEIIVKIMDKLLNTILNIKGDIVHYKLMLLNIALCLKSHLVTNIKISTFVLYINTLQTLLLSKCMKVIVTKEHMIEILEFSKKLLDDTDECDDMLRFGCEYVTNAPCSKNNDEIEVAKNSLRTLVWTWCVHDVK
ncbi:Nucleolar pre-ribosomal-associated protein 1 [Anthophora quadrimaculata]